ncbi:unnamed protein product [Spirodela intermedia]|uniref:Uncharacterized protein n=2 Tax=Spirodela intermedia TaxID=51605 RepID=A0A7I8LK07_SPIIN|nr:unnamed protein product [Spirodela intermedia]CAA6673155.1 unnamed protein product [Spirodela intermedia]CAA7410377.1 unnamed protein product [Spirodela intermedia]
MPSSLIQDDQPRPPALATATMNWGRVTGRQRSIFRGTFGMAVDVI